MDAYENTDWALNSVSVVEVLEGHNDLEQTTSAQQPTFDPLNEIVIFDGTDDNMVGLPPQSGNFSYVFKGLDITSDETQRFLQDIGADSNIRINNSNIIRVRDTLNVDSAVTGTDTSGVKDLVFTLESDMFSVYGDGVLQGQLDLTGRSLSFNALSNTASALNGSLSELGVYDRALTLEEIEKISGIEPVIFLADGDGNILNDGTNDLIINE